MKNNLWQRILIAFMIFFISLEYFSGVKAGRAKSFVIPQIPKDERWVQFDDGEYHGMAFRGGEGATVVHVTKDRNQRDYILAASLGVGYLLLAFVDMRKMMGGVKTDTTDL